MEKLDIMIKLVNERNIDQVCIGSPRFISTIDLF